MHDGQPYSPPGAFNLCHVSDKQSEALRAVLLERYYQRLRWGTRLGVGGEHGGQVFAERPQDVGNFLVYMKVYLDKALARYSSEEGPYGALDELRKVAALAVACFEQYRCPRRRFDEKIINGHDGQVAYDPAPKGDERT
jgi:hypothetical protein